MLLPSIRKVTQISILIGSALACVALYFYLPAFEEEKVPRRAEFLYQTWELDHVYRNGQRVIDERNEGLKITILPDSTAMETVRGLSYKTTFYADQKLEYLYTGQQGKPVRYKIYTLTPNLLKYGQHNAAARYIFVLNAVKK
jgi:hypothetical protein